METPTPDDLPPLNHRYPFEFFQRVEVTRPRPSIGTVSNTFADGFGIWHAEIEVREGNGSVEVFGAPLRTIYNRASKALTKEVQSRQGPTTPPVKVDYLGLRRRSDGSMYALFRERTQ